MPVVTDGWMYRTFLWRDGDGDFEAWVKGIHADGWQLWTTSRGTWATINGRRTFVLSVRRPDERPWATPPG